MTNPTEGDTPTPDPKQPDAPAGDTGDKGGDGETIPKASYEVVQKKYHSMKEENANLQKQLETFNAEKKKAEEAKMQEEGKYKELVEQKEAEIKTLNEKIQSQVLNSAIINEATKAGAVDNDAVLALIDKSDIQVVDGKIDTSKIKDAVESLKQSKSYLFGTAKPNIGTAGGAGDGEPNTKRIYKRSELRDPEFYAKNETDILLAMRENRIVEG